MVLYGVVDQSETMLCIGTVLYFAAWYGIGTVFRCSIIYSMGTAQFNTVPCGESYNNKEGEC